MIDPEDEEEDEDEEDDDDGEISIDYPLFEPEGDEGPDEFWGD